MVNRARTRATPARGAVELRKDVADLRLLLESVSDYAIFMLDPAGRVATWNHGAEQLKGYGAPEIVGKHFSVFYTPEDRASGKPQRLLEIAEKEGRAEDEGWRLRKDGSRFWANVVITALRSERGELHGFAKVARDLTERRSVEEELKHANDELRRRTGALERSNADLEQFATVASHDLSEPLRVIRGFAEILEQRLRARLDEEEQAFLAHLISGTRRMQDLVDGLLAYSRIARLVPSNTVTDLTAIVTACLDDLAARVREAGATVVVNPLPVVSGDPTVMRQLFQNLLANALKFVHPDRFPTITVTAQRENSGWRISVTDNGMGVASRHRQRIFGMFARLHTDEEYPGTGIGLAICKRIVEQRGGRIWVEDNPGEGSVFCFTLPDELPND